MRLIAIDGNSLMYRAFYALPDMTNKQGVPTGALHGFLGMLVKLIGMKPSHMLVAFDLPGKTFRHDSYDAYKAGRRETPDALKAQMPMIKELLTRMGIAVIDCPRYEADDILGTFAKRASGIGLPALLVTGDRDALQLIDENVHVLMTKRGISETVEYDKATIKRDYGLEPAKMVDLKALMGDSSDNIPGIKGIGEKTALKLLEKYGDLETVLASAQCEKGALGRKIADGADSARMSYRLGLVETQAPVARTLDECAFSINTLENALPELARLELRSISSRLKTLLDENGGAKSETETMAEYKSERRETVSDAAGLEAARDALKRCAAVYADVSQASITFIGIDVELITPLYAVTLGGTLLEPGLSPDEALAAFKPIFESERIGKIVFDAKRLMLLLANYGIELNNLTFDAMIADYLLNAVHPAKDLSMLAAENSIPAEGAQALMLLHARLERSLEESEMNKLYYEVELPLVRVLFEMERAGFAVDKQALAEMGDELAERIDELAGQAYSFAGETFNILSPKQLGAVLFDKIGLPPRKKTKTGYSTDSEVLEALRDMHPIIPVIMEYRFLTKLKSTFIDALIAKVGSDGRIHTTFNQNVTATGRISSTEPNLQNIPVRTEQGREIRRAFIASPGCLLVGADYSQIELRVLAHMSGDEAFVEAFRNGEDIHTRTASEVFDVAPELVTRQMRSAAKAVNFGIVYGISAFGLSEQLGITPKKASDYIEKYLSRCEGIRAYMHNSVESAGQMGYAKTIMGRRRALAELNSSNHNTRAFGERVAMNMPIQGSAADIIKLAMVRVHDELKARGLKAKLVLQVHDELLIDTPEDEAEQVVPLLRECMCSVVQLKVPLTADVNCARSWYDTK